MATLRRFSAQGRPLSHDHAYATAFRGLMVLGCLLAALAETRLAQAQSPLLRRTDPLAATTSDTARRDAISSIPFEQLDRDGRDKVASILQDVTTFRRLPTQVIDCSPQLFLFLVRQPDVAVNIWQVLELSQIDLRQTAPSQFQLVEPTGTRMQAEFLYQSPEVHVIYGEGVYVGPILNQPVHGRCLMVLRSGYVQETNGRHYVTARLDTFLQIQERAPDLLTKLLHPVAGKAADHNFTQIAAFAGSLSRTAEVNCQGVQRLATRLTSVQPEVRIRLAEIAAAIAKDAQQPAAGTTGVGATSVLASHESP